MFINVQLVRGGEVEGRDNKDILMIHFQLWYIRVLPGKFRLFSVNSAS